jgi:hypothetical protein
MIKRNSFVFDSFQPLEQMNNQIAKDNGKKINHPARVAGEKNSQTRQIRLFFFKENIPVFPISGLHPKNKKQGDSQRQKIWKKEFESGIKQKIGYGSIRGEKVFRQKIISPSYELPDGQKR